MTDARQTRMKSQAEAKAAVDAKRAARRAAAALKERFGDDFDVTAHDGALTFGPSALYRLVEAVRTMAPDEALEFQGFLRCVRATKPDVLWSRRAQGPDVLAHAFDMDSGTSVCERVVEGNPEVFRIDGQIERPQRFCRLCNDRLKQRRAKGAA